MTILEKNLNDLIRKIIEDNKNGEHQASKNEDEIFNDFLCETKNLIFENNLDLCIILQRPASKYFIKILKLYIFAKLKEKEAILLKLKEFMKELFVSSSFYLEDVKYEDFSKLLAAMDYFFDLTYEILNDTAEIDIDDIL